MGIAAALTFTEDDNVQLEYVPDIGKPATRWIYAIIEATPDEDADAGYSVRIPDTFEQVDKWGSWVRQHETKQDVEDHWCRMPPKKFKPITTELMPNVPYDCLRKY